MLRTEASRLASLVGIIRQAADPERIILFGSRVKDAARAGIDDDFLVVVSHVDNERQVSRRIYRALLDQGVDVPVDVIVVDQATLERHHDTPGMVYREALTEGEVAYDRTGV